jgi:hypothetical protein
MANLNYDSFTESVRTILKLRLGQDDAIVKEIVEASVRDLIKEWDSEIGSRIDYCLKIDQVDLGCDKTVSRIYLPDEATWVVECYVGNVLVTPIDLSDKKFWGDYTVESQYISGLNAFVGRDECGKVYLEFAAPLCPPDDVPISVLYRISSSDVTYIPEAYKTLMLYTAVYHYRNWYTMDNPAAVSKAKENMRNYRAEFVAEQGNQVMNQKRPYEVEWKKMFRFVLEGSQNDLSSRFGTV